MDVLKCGSLVFHLVVSLFKLAECSWCRWRWPFPHGPIVRTAFWMVAARCARLEPLPPSSSSIPSSLHSRRKQHWTTASFCHPPSTPSALAALAHPRLLTSSLLPFPLLLILLPLSLFFFPSPSSSLPSSAASSMLRCASFLLPCEFSTHLYFFVFVGTP